MAESIAMLFGDATWEILEQKISDIAERINPEEWRYPCNNSEYTVSIYKYDSWVDECDDSDIDVIVKMLGDLPSSILCIELRRSVQQQACLVTIEICKDLLSQFSGIVDDAIDKYWTLTDIQKSDLFLKQYR